MKTLYINVLNKIATYQKRCGDIVCGNSDYQIQFTFDSEWDEYTTKTARFIWGGQYFDVEFTGDTCTVPVIQNATQVEVGVYAGQISTTTSAVIGCKLSILCGATEPNPGTGQHYTNEAKAAAEEAKRSESNAAQSATTAQAAATEVVESVSGGKCIFANALKGKSSGAIVALDDVSPLEHKVGVKLSSKNLLTYPFVNTTRTHSGITFTDNGDGTITANGTCTPAQGVPYAEFAVYKGSGENVAARLVLSGCPSGGSASTYHIVDSPTGQRDIGNGAVYGHYLNRADIRIRIYPGVTVENLVFKPMLIMSETGGVVPFTPYVAGDKEITVKSCGKNLFNNTYWDLDRNESDTISTGGVRYTRLEDGRLHLKGVVNTFSALNIFADGTTQFSDFLRNGATYCFSVQAEGTGSNGVLVGGQYTDSEGKNMYIMSNDERYIHTVNKSLNSYNWLRIQVVAGTEVDCIVGIQIEPNNEVTEYEPFTEYATITTTIAEGAELPSVAPNMTIFTDNEGVVIDAEYNKDSNIVIEKLTQAIISMGGFV